MGIIKRDTKNKSFLSSKKNLRGGKFCIIALYFLVACQTSSTVPQLPKPPDYLLLEGVRQITFDGDNDSPKFSPDGKRVVFISRERTAHKNTQVYEVNLDENQVRRVTFQDGEIRDPLYIDNNTILYASSTDEIKETLIERSQKNSTDGRPPMELYQSDLYGNKIVRITHFPGHDSEPEFVSGRRPYILFASYRAGLLGIFKFDLRLRRRQTSYFLLDKEKERWNPAVSDDRRYVAWLEKDVDDDGVRIMVTQLRRLISSMKVAKEKEKDIRDLSFIPKSHKLIYSIQRDEEPHQIEILDFEKNCTQIVFSGNDSLVQPSVNEAGNQVVLTRVFNNSVNIRRQIYSVPLPEDLGPCLESIPPL